MSLLDKKIIITGASTGLGAEIANKVAENKGTPILIARSENKLSEIVTEIKAKWGIEAKYYVFDLDQMDSIHSFVETIINVEKNVDIVVNNAGFGIFENLIEADPEQIEKMFRVNVISLIYFTQACLPYMLTRNRGQIINIASQAGKVGSPKSTIYASTKHAVLGFTNSLRMELSKTNIQITAVNPGPIKTSFFDTADKSGEYVKNAGKYMLDSKAVADKIVKVMIRPKREVNIPGWMNIGSVFYQLFPTLFEKVLGPIIHKK